VFAFGGGQHGFVANFMGNNRDKERHLRMIRSNVAKKAKVAKPQRRF
jgi:hypothetical protein